MPAVRAGDWSAGTRRRVGGRARPTDGWSLHVVRTACATASDVIQPRWGGGGGAWGSGHSAVRKVPTSGLAHTACRRGVGTVAEVTLQVGNTERLLLRMAPLFCTLSFFRLPSFFLLWVLRAVRDAPRHWQTSPDKSPGSKPYSFVVSIGRLQPFSRISQEHT